MKVLVVDDEALARRRIVDYFRAARPGDTVEEAEDGFEALEKLATFAPDLVFLDVEMPELSGFDVLMQLEARPFRVIFQTAYDEFAVRAFDANAIDYLLKPFSDERLAQAIAKAGGPPQALGDLDRHLVGEKMHLTKLTIRLGQRLKVVDAADVHYFLSESHVTRAFLHDIDYALDNSLTFLEERLDPRTFLRTHRNSLINLTSIKEVKQGSNMTVTLKSGVELPVSRERKKQLLKALGLGRD